MTSSPALNFPNVFLFVTLKDYNVSKLFLLSLVPISTKNVGWISSQG